MKSVLQKRVQRVNSRTPHGVRGLKFERRVRNPRHAEVAPLTGCVD